jgi:predicted phage tail protein
LAGAVYTLENNTINPVVNQKFRCIDIKDNGNSTYNVTGLEFNDSIYEVADNTTNNKAKLEYEDVTGFNNRPTKPENLEVTSTRIQLQNSSTNRVTFSWSRGINGSNVNFTVRFKKGNGNFKIRKNIDETSFELDNVKTGTVIKFEVRSESIDALKSKHSAYVKAPSFTVGQSLFQSLAEFASENPVPVPLP